MRVEQIKCDVCGRAKGEGNHWLGATVSEDPPYIGISGSSNVDLDLCSEECMQKLLAMVLVRIRAHSASVSVISYPQ